MKKSIVLVTWDDAYIDLVDLPWEDACELQPLTRQTVGFLINITDDAYILATDVYKYNGDYVHAPMVIPKGMVSKIETITI